MSGPRLGSLRGALAPLGALVALGLLAGVMIGREAAGGDVVKVVSPDRGVPQRAARPEAQAGAIGPLTGTGASTVGAAEAVGTAEAVGAAGAWGTAEAGRGPTGYAFLLMQPDQLAPVRWDPCHPVTFKVASSGLMPASEIVMVRAAFATVGA